MAQRSTQPPTEMSTRNLPVGKKRLACKADNLTAISEQVFLYDPCAQKCQAHMISRPMSGTATMASEI
jgi:hypothetical protein